MSIQDMINKAKEKYIRPQRTIAEIKEEHMNIRKQRKQAEERNDIQQEIQKEKAALKQANKPAFLRASEGKVKGFFAGIKENNKKDSSIFNKKNIFAQEKGDSNNIFTSGSSKTNNTRESYYGGSFGGVPGLTRKETKQKQRAK